MQTDMEYASLSWKRRVFGIGPRVGSLVASDMIHPLSPFARSVTTLSGLFLLYTACVSDLPFLQAEDIVYDHACMCVSCCCCVLLARKTCHVCI